MVPAGGQEVADEAEVVGQLIAVDLGHIPARDIGVAVHEGGVVAHLRRHGSEQMADALLMGHVHVEVADHVEAAESANALLAPAELPGFHIALHDIDPVLLVEADPRDLVEAHHGD